MKKLFAIMLALIMVLAFIPAAATTAATSGTEITKVWDDEGHQNERPQSVQVQLLEGTNVVETITLTAEANWTGTFSYPQDPDKTYTIQEVNVPANYTPSYTAPEEKLTVGNWGEKITPASNPTYTLTGNIVVANKGGSYYIWTQDKLNEQQKSKLMAAINAASLEGLGKGLAADNTEFQYGISATFDGGEVSIKNEGSNTTITFSEKNVWSLFYEGTLSIEPATGWIVKNTYTKTESDPETETVTISIPIYKEVRQGGNTAPGEQTFTFVLSNFGANDAASQVTVENNTIETNGAGYYETVMTVTVDKENFGNLSEGFKVTERNDGAPYWAYDATEWKVVPGMNDDQSTYCTFYNQTAGDKETQTPYNGISFTNIYTYNYNGGYYPAPVRPVQPAPLPPQTGDMPLWYAVAQFLGLVK